MWTRAAGRRKMSLVAWSSAISSLVRNRSITRTHPSAAAAYVPIAEALPFYKTQFLTRFYSGQQTNISVAAQIADSVLYGGDCRDYLLVMDRINAVSPEEVARAARTWLRDNPTQWIVLGDSALLKDVNREDFLGYTGP